MRVNTRNSFAYYCVYPVVTSYNLSTKKRLIGQKVCVKTSKEAYRTKSVCESPYNTRYLLVL